MPDSKEDTKSAALELIAANKTIEGFKQKHETLLAALAPVAKELVRPTITMLKAVTSFYGTMQVGFQFVGGRLDALAQAVVASDLVGKVRALVDAYGALSVAEFNTLIPGEVPGVTPPEPGDLPN